MPRRDRRKQKKKKERQERLRRDTHLRQSLPCPEDEGEFEERDLEEAENLSGATPVMPSRFTTEHTPQNLDRGIEERGLERNEDLAAGVVPTGREPAGRTDASCAEGPATGDPAKSPLDNFFVGKPAREWLDALLARTDTMPIVSALEPAEYVPRELLLKASLCCEILVAAELVAAGRGRPSRHFPAPVARWLREQDVLFSPGVVALATTAVRRVGEFSELRQLWDTVRLGPQWLQGVEGLINRLQQ
jgi:hypothetical protein